jgi:hypothetical protein
MSEPNGQFPAMREFPESNIVDSAAALEAKLRLDPTNLEAIIDLAILYWTANDHGIAISIGLPVEFSSMGWRRWRELLELAESLYPKSPAVSFWAKYIRSIEGEEPFRLEECRELLRRQPEFLDPAMAVFAWSGGKEAQEEAARLIENCAPSSTWRCQYVRSMIEKHLGRSI